MRAKRHYLVGAVAAAAFSVAFSSCNSSNRSDEKQVAAAENEVYDAVIHDMIGSAKGPGQLVFDDTLLTELAPEADTKSCEEAARKNLLLLEYSTPVKVGSPVWVIATIENKSDHDLPVYRAISDNMDQGGWVYTVDVRDNKGVARSETNFHRIVQGRDSEVGMKKSGWVTKLKPGKRWRIVST